MLVPDLDLALAVAAANFAAFREPGRAPGFACVGHGSTRHAGSGAARIERRKRREERHRIVAQNYRAAPIFDGPQPALGDVFVKRCPLDRRRSGISSTKSS